METKLEREDAYFGSRSMLLICFINIYFSLLCLKLKVGSNVVNVFFFHVMYLVYSSSICFRFSSIL